MTEENKFSEEICDDQNKNCIRCQFCNSLMLKSKAGQYLESDFKLPLMHQKNTKKPDEIETEELSHFWIIDDIFTFENIGFSNTIQNAKYLICADCEMGPVGYHDILSKKSYIALKRVKHI